MVSLSDRKGTSGQEWAANANETSGNTIPPATAGREKPISEAMTGRRRLASLMASEALPARAGTANIKGICGNMSRTERFCPAEVLQPLCFLVLNRKGTLCPSLHPSLGASCAFLTVGGTESYREKTAYCVPHAICAAECAAFLCDPPRTLRFYKHLHQSLKTYLSLSMKTQTFILTLGAALLIAACGSGSPEQDPKQALPPALPPQPAASAPDIRIETFQNEEKTWGYDLYLDGKRYIHQPHKPAVGGKKGFETEAQAQRVAELVAERARKGIMPPSVTAEEVDSLASMN